MTPQIIGTILLCLSAMLMWLSKGRKWRSRKAITRQANDYVQGRIAAQDMRLYSVHPGRIPMYLAWACLIITGIIDIPLWLGHHQTITQYVISLTPGWYGLGLMVFICLHTAIVFGRGWREELKILLIMTVGVLCGHFWT